MKKATKSETVYPAIRFGRKRPLNLSPDTESLYAPNFSASPREIRIVFLENVIGNIELLLFKGTQIYEESFVWPSQMKYYRNWLVWANFLRKNYLNRSTVTEKRPVLWCLDNYSTGGYYHWISEVLPRMWLLKAYFAESVLAIPEYMYVKWKFVPEIVEAMGVTATVLLTNKLNIQANTLILATQTGGPLDYQPEPIKESTQYLMSRFGISRGTPVKRLYITRRNAKSRRIVNEDELYPVLEKYGFEVVEPEKMRLKDQIALFSVAEIICGPHGAGFTNMVFAPVTAKIIELRLPYINHVFNCFYTLADTFSLPYYFLEGQSSNDPECQVNRSDDHSFRISPEKLESLLANILK